MITTFVAFDSPGDLLSASFAMLHEPDFGRVHPDAIAEARAAFAGLREPDPAAFPVADNREQIRRRLALSMRFRF